MSEPQWPSPNKEKRLLSAEQIREDINNGGFMLWRSKQEREDFPDICDILDEDYEKAESKEARHNLLMEYYYKSVHGDYSSACFFAQLRERKLYEAGVTFGNIPDSIEGKKDYYPYDDCVIVYQHGRTRIYDVDPGFWASVQLGERDVIGSSAFSCCIAVVARQGDKTTMGHVRMGDVQHTKGIVRFMAQQGGEGMIFTIVMPERKSDDKIGDERVNSRMQKMIKDLQTELDVQSFTYPYIMVGMQNNPHKVNSTSVIVGSDFLRIVGTKEIFTKKGSQHVCKFKPIQETIEEISFE